MSILVTGAAGFIGFHVTRRLLEQGIPTIGFDNFNNYYDQSLKRSRVNELLKLASNKKVPFCLIEENLENAQAIENAFSGKDINGSTLSAGKPTKVLHLAAQAGVRYSIENPSAYIQANLVGFSHILEGCRNQKIEHLIYASSSSVYGGNTNMPFEESQGVDHPISLYAATKKSNELMAHTYSHLYNLPTTGLRFFTVYGPWGRPDMALFLFTKSILEKKPIKVFNYGDMVRDFTYISDIVESISRIIDKPPRAVENFDKNKPDPSLSWAPYRIFNIGNSQPTPLIDYIQAIENALGMKADLIMEEMQPGDVPATSANTSALENWTGFKPRTSIIDGVKEFVKWYRTYYDV